MDDSAEFVVHQRAGVNADQRLGRRPDVIRGQVRAVGKLGVDQAVHRDCRVRGDLDKGVQGEGQAVVQFVCEVLEQAGIINGNIKRQVTGVDEVGVLAVLLFRTSASLLSHTRGRPRDQTLSSVRFLDRLPY